MSRENPFSGYAQFQMAFKGYDFYDLKKKIVLNKYEMWTLHNRKCLEFTYSMKQYNKLKPQERFNLIDRLGWYRGKKINRL